MQPQQSVSGPKSHSLRNAEGVTSCESENEGSGWKLAEEWL